MKYKDNKEIDKYRVERVSPIFYKYCSFCGKDFKGDYGWKFYDPWYSYDGAYYNDKKYICCKCSENESDARKKAEEWLKNKYIKRKNRTPTDQMGMYY